MAVKPLFISNPRNRADVGWAGLYTGLPGAGAVDLVFLTRMRIIDDVPKSAEWGCS